MTTNTRKTSTTARITALESTVAGLDAKFDLLLGRLGVSEEVAPQVEAPKTGKKAKAQKAEATVTAMVPFRELRLRLKEHKLAGAIPAGVTAKEAIAAGLMTETGDLPGTVPTAKPAKAAKGKTAKATPAKAAAPKAAKPEGTALRSKTLPEFVAANKWAEGMSVREVASAVVVDGRKVKGGFYVGERYRNLVLTGSWDGTPVEVTEEPKAGKKAKAEAPVVAQAKVDEPAWGTQEWIEQTHPREKDTPRNAKGQPTRKAEWPLRIALEATGKFDRHEVDQQVANVLGS